MTHTFTQNEIHCTVCHVHPAENMPSGFLHDLFPWNSCLTWSCAQLLNLFAPIISLIYPPTNIPLPTPPPADCLHPILH